MKVKLTKFFDYAALTPEQRRQYIDQNLVKNEDGKVTAKIGKYKIEITLEKKKRPSEKM